MTVTSPIVGKGAVVDHCEAMDKVDVGLEKEGDIGLGDGDLDPHQTLSMDEEGEAELAAFDRKMLLKLDVIVIPVIAMLYLLVFVDRVNIGNARVAGLQRDLGMTDLQYQTGKPNPEIYAFDIWKKHLANSRIHIAVAVTYVLYIAAELPSNLLLKKLGPRVLLPGLCFTWGVVTTLQCLVKNYRGLIAVRLMLGLAEGGKSMPGKIQHLNFKASANQS